MAMRSRYFATVYELRPGKLTELVPPEGMVIDGWMAAALSARTVSGDTYTVPGLAIIYSQPNPPPEEPDTTPSKSSNALPSEPPVTAPASPVAKARGKKIESSRPRHRTPRRAT
jgi:hypothetical protein